MVETQSIGALVGGFIAVAILIGLGPQILGNTVMDCTNLPGYVDTGTPATTNSTGWAFTCIQANDSTQNAYSLLIIVLVVIAAVVILFVVKLL